MGTSIRDTLVRPISTGILWLLAFPCTVVLFDLMTDLIQTSEGQTFLGSALLGTFATVASRSFRLLGTFAHELTHVAAAWVCGGRVRELRVSRDEGGHVVLTHSNAAVALAPYSVPLFALSSAALIPFLSSPVNLIANAGIGFLYGNFLGDTLRSLKVEQPDLVEVDCPLLAASAMLAGNVASLAFILGVLSPSAFAHAALGGVEALSDLWVGVEVVAALLG